MNQCHNTASLTIATLRLSRQTENATDKPTLVRAITSLGDWGVSYRLHQAGSEDKISLRMATSSEMQWQRDYISDNSSGVIVISHAVVLPLALINILCCFPRDGIRPQPIGP